MPLLLPPGLMKDINGFAILLVCMPVKTRYLHSFGGSRLLAAAATAHRNNQSDAAFAPLKSSHDDRVARTRPTCDKACRVIIAISRQLFQ